MTDETAAERITEYMASRAETAASIFAVADGTATQDEDGYPLTQDEAYDRLNEWPLSVEIVKHVKILLGTGGPADWLDAELDTDGDLRTLRYHFADWGTHADQYVENDSPLWRAAEHFVEGAYFLIHPQND